MALRIITISRQYGSGGRLIGKEVAERLGINYYDRELLKEVAKESGYTLDYIEKQGEYKTYSGIDYTPICGDSTLCYDVVTEPANNVVNIQNDLITRIAESKPCVIVGRAADFILRNRNDVLNVFIYSDEQTRIKCIADKYEHVSYEEATKIMKQRDKLRKKHYHFYTDRSWGQLDNYHLCIDTGKLSREFSVELLCSVYERMNASC